MNQGEVVLHEPKQLDLTFVLRVIDDKQINGVIWLETSGESLDKITSYTLYSALTGVYSILQGCPNVK